MNTWLVLIISSQFYYVDVIFVNFGKTIFIYGQKIHVGKKFRHDFHKNITALFRLVSGLYTKMVI